MDDMIGLVIRDSDGAIHKEMNQHLNKGSILLIRKSLSESSIIITCTIKNNDVTIDVKYNNPSVEDKRIADTIEQKIREGFKKYHEDKTKDSIDI